ncbi:MAG: hypothetical protein ACXVLT_07085 [Flavisolibacter sp.]
MKAILFFLIAINLSFTAFSQITKNNWLVGGNGKLFSDNSDYSSDFYSYTAKHTQIDISASVGYFFIDKLAVGLRPTFSSLKGKVTSIGGGTTNTQRFWFGPFARYYFLQKDKQFNLLADIDYQFGIIKSGQWNGDLNSFNACAGPVIYFNNCVGVEFLFGYAYSKEDVKEGSKLVNKGFQTAIGFQIHLEK